MIVSVMIAVPMVIMVAVTVVIVADIAATRGEHSQEKSGKQNS